MIRPTCFSRLLLALMVGVAGLLVAPASARAAAPIVQGAEAPLGVALPGAAGSVRSEESAIGTLADGRTLVAFAAAGGGGLLPRFFAMDLAGTKVAEFDLPAGENVSALVYNPARRSFFVSSDDNANGRVYEWTGGTAVAQRVSIPGHKIQALAAAPKGDVYVGTFASGNGRLYRWATSGTLTDMGQPIAGQSYVRAIAATADAVYTSNYASAPTRLAKITTGGVKTDVPLQADIASEKSIESLMVAGNYLLGRTADSGRLFALNLSTLGQQSFNDQISRSWTTGETVNVVPYLSNVSPYTVSPLVEGRYIYLQRSGAGLMRIDTADGFKTIRVDKYFKGDIDQTWNGATVSGPTSFAWLDGALGRGPSVVSGTIDGKLIVNTPAQTGPASATLTSSGSSSLVWSMGTSPQGSILAGGYNLPVGIAKYDATKTILAGPQIEGFGAYGTDTYMGGYTGAAGSASGPIYRYTGSRDPVQVKALGNEQERPVAFARVGDQLAIGSIPVKNVFGGALSIYDPATGAMAVNRNLIPNQSIISLASHNGLVVGGSSNTGGTGVTPSASTWAVLFTYDPSTGALQTVTPPGPDSSTWRWVGGVTPDPAGGGKFWAIATGNLIQFQVDPGGSISILKNLGAFGGGTSSPSGRELGIVFNNGTLFATLGGGLRAVNPSTGESVLVADKTAKGDIAHLVTPDGGKTLYYSRGVEVFKYAVSGATVPVDTCDVAPVITSHQADTYYAPNQDVVFTGKGAPGSAVTLVSGSRTRKATVDANGNWSMYQLWMGSWSGPMTFTGSKAGCPDQSSTIRVWFVANPGKHYAAKLTGVDGATYEVMPYVSTSTYAGNQQVVFSGTGTPGALVTMHAGNQLRYATVRPSGYWTMRWVQIGVKPATLQFTSELAGYPSYDTSFVVKFQ